MRMIFRNELGRLLIIILALSWNGFTQIDQDDSRDSLMQKYLSCDAVVAERMARLNPTGASTPKSLYAPFDPKPISSSLKSLLTDINVNELIAYQFKGRRDSTLVMITNRVGRPLSAESVQDWFIQVDKKAFRFKSIATNPNLVFWDNGRLNHLVILYNSEAKKDKQSNLVSLDITRMQLRQEATTELIEEERNVRCVLRTTKPG